MGFLEDRGSLTGDPLEALDHALDELRDAFHQRARDRSHWGLAKSMVMQMHAEGLDPGAPGALDAWIDDFNTRPLERRDQIIGPAADRMAHAAGLPHGRGARAQTRAPGDAGPARRAQTQPSALTPSGAPSLDGPLRSPSSRASSAGRAPAAARGRCPDQRRRVIWQATRRA